MTNLFMQIRLTIVVFLISSVAVASELNFDIKGLNSLHGSYQGVLQILDKKVIRIIQYDQFTYENNKVQSVWTGDLNSLQINFKLELAQVLTGFDNYQATDHQINNPEQLKINLPSTPSPGGQVDFSFTSANEGSFQETWIFKSASFSNPIWRSQRQTLTATGGSGPLLIKIAEILGINTVIDWYRGSPEAQAYKNRAEFASKNQYLITDPTDYDFYQTHKDVVRITDKFINPLSLAEALQRQHAYGPSLEQKAQDLTQAMEQINLNSAGMLENAVVDNNGQKIGVLYEYDSALWTAAFGFSQVLRYETTKDDSAYQNFVKVLLGELTLVEISAGYDDFARTLAISPSSQNLGATWIQGTGEYSHLKWQRGGNNDMFKGIALTYTMAAKILKGSDRLLLTRVEAATRELMKKSSIKKGSFNIGMLWGLVALLDPDPKVQFEAMKTFESLRINALESIADLTKAANGFYVGGISDWSGIQLNMMSNLVEINLSEELEAKVDKNLKSIAAEVRRNCDRRIFQIWKIYRPLHRHFLTLVANAYSSAARADAEFQTELNSNAIWGLREMTSPRSVGAGVIELSRRKKWSLSAWPRIPWKALKGPLKLKPDLSFSEYEQGAYAYPLFESSMWDSDFAWSDDPFTFRHQGRQNTQIISSDYLLIYWVSRSSGFVH